MGHLPLDPISGGHGTDPGRAITSMPVKQTRITLPDQTRTAGANWTASCVTSGHLVAELRGTAKFRPGNHALLMGEGMERIIRRYAGEAEIALGESRSDVSNSDAQRLGRIQRTWVWLLVLPSTVNGPELGAQDWRESPILHYGIDQTNLPSHCDGCGAEFTICHDLDCKKDGLITTNHNELRNGVADLAGKAFNPAHVRGNPKICTGRAVRGREAKVKVK